MVRTTKDFDMYAVDILPDLKFYFYKNDKLVCIFFTNLSSKGIIRFKEYLKTLNLEVDTIMSLITSTDYSSVLLAAEIINKKILEVYKYEEAFVDSKNNIIKRRNSNI